MRLRFRCSLLFLPFAAAFAADHFVQVLEVLEGDTMIVRLDGRRTKVRLYGVDSPDKGQNYFKEARDFTTKLALEQYGLIRSYGEDHKGVLRIEFVFKDGKNLNRKVVGAGWGWWTDRYDEATFDLKVLENEAKFYRHGLWKDMHPIPPWDYREKVK